MNMLKQQRVVHGPVHPIKIGVVQKEHPNKSKQVVCNTMFIYIMVNVVVLAPYIKGKHNGYSGYGMDTSENKISLR